MRDIKRHVLLGMLSGSLITIGAALLSLFMLSWWFLRHVYITQNQPPKVLVFLICPTLLLIAGVTLAWLTLRNKSTNGRTAAGLILLVIPLLAPSMLPWLGIFLGSFGMGDIHWNQSRYLAYVAFLFVVVTLCLCAVAGVKLLKRTA